MLAFRIVEECFEGGKPHAVKLISQDDCYTTCRIDSELSIVYCLGICCSQRQRVFFHFCFQLKHIGHRKHSCSFLTRGILARPPWRWVVPRPQPIPTPRERVEGVAAILVHFGTQTACRLFATMCTHTWYISPSDYAHIPTLRSCFAGKRSRRSKSGMEYSP